MRTTIILVAILLAASLSANAGIPMLMIEWPFMILSLLPIIYFEAWVIQKYIKLTHKQLLKITTASNFASTLIGVPLTYAIILVLQYLLTDHITIQANNSWGLLVHSIIFPALAIPAENSLWFIFPVSGSVLLVFYFLVSWQIEKLATRFLLKNQNISSQIISKSVLLANIYSYLALFVIWVALNAIWFSWQ